MFYQVLALVFGFIIAAIFYWYFTIPKNIPPLGPFSFPYIGHRLAKYENKLYLKIDEWAKKYGGLYSFYVGNQLVVVIADYDLAKESFVKQAEYFVGKHDFWLIKRLQFDQGLLMNNGALWREHRRFSLSTLRDFGLGKPIMENGIVEELYHVCNVIREADGKPLDLQYLMNNAVSNVICQLVFGRRFAYDDEEFQRVLRSVNFQTSASLSLGVFVRPWMMIVPWLRKRVNYGEQQIEVIKKFVQKYIDFERRHFDLNDEATNYIQAYLKEQQTVAARSSQDHVFTDLQLQMSVHALFSAGTETTSTTLRWALLFCTKFVEIQRKIHDELDDVVGRNSDPKVGQRQQLPYLEAVLLETQRYASLVPLSIRYTYEDTVLRSYRIPKNTVILRNNWSVHHGEKYFPNPSEFRPDRFFDDSGKLQRPETLIPFGMGKRSCLGEGLAKMELFLFFAHLMHKFCFTFPSYQKDPPLDFVPGLTLQPVPFDLIATPRI